MIQYYTGGIGVRVTMEDLLEERQVEQLYHFSKRQTLRLDY